MSNPWFRVYNEMLHDRKLAKAAKAAGLDKVSMIGIFVALLCIANESPVPGALYVTLHERFGNDDVTNELEIDGATWEKARDALIRYEMLEIVDGVFWVKNWGKRQFKSDVSTQRVRKHRQKNDGNGNETFHGRFGNAPEAEAESETEAEVNAAASADDLWTPETPLEAQQNPQIRIFREVTGRLPGKRDYRTVVETIHFLAASHGDELTDYLAPYWLAWSGRKTQTGRPYDPGNIAWLTEWAVNGEIPEAYRNPATTGTLEDLGFGYIGS
jgi:hypothetical protein